MKYDIVLLTDPRYLHPKKDDAYTTEVILEDTLIQESMTNLGINHARVSWDDPTFDWSSTKYALFRAVWDYFDRYDEFTAWYQNTANLTNFINSKELIDWNIDKHYMMNLSKKGVHIPKTLYIETGENLNLFEAIQKGKQDLGFASNEFVLKPCIAGGAWHTYKFHESEWQKHDGIFRQLIQKEAMMLQEFQKKIVANGEVSLMYMGGKFTHAILKRAKKGDFRVQNDYGGSIELYEASKEEKSFGQKVIEACSALPLYARVDIFEDNEGNIALAELEIFEPELWFRCYPDAAKDFAYALKTYLSI